MVYCHAAGIQWHNDYANWAPSIFVILSLCEALKWQSPPPPPMAKYLQNDHKIYKFNPSDSPMTLGCNVKPPHPRLPVTLWGIWWGESVVFTYRIVHMICKTAVLEAEPCGLKIKLRAEFGPSDSGP